MTCLRRLHHGCVESGHQCISATTTSNSHNWDASHPLSFPSRWPAPRSTQKDVAIDGNYDPELRWHQLLDVFTCTCPLSARTMGFVIRMCGAKASEDCGKCCGSAPGNANPASATITGFASTINQSISRDHASHLPSPFKCTSGWVQNPT